MYDYKNVDNFSNFHRLFDTLRYSSILFLTQKSTILRKELKHNMTP
jgi:hypothetical protein